MEPKLLEHHSYVVVLPHTHACRGDEQVSVAGPAEPGQTPKVTRNGPAWIARVKLSKSGRIVYFNGKALKRAIGGGISGNHVDLQTGEEYWVSGVKKDGLDRHGLARASSRSRRARDQASRSSAS